MMLIQDFSVWEITTTTITILDLIVIFATVIMITNVTINVKNVTTTTTIILVQTVLIAILVIAVPTLVSILVENVLILDHIVDLPVPILEVDQIMDHLLVDQVMDQVLLIATLVVALIPPLVGIVATSVEILLTAIMDGEILEQVPEIMEQQIQLIVMKVLFLFLMLEIKEGLPTLKKSFNSRGCES